MAKIVFFSDLHIHAFPEFGSADRLNDCLSVLTDIRKWCVKHGVKDVFFGGDLMHKRGILWTASYVAVANELLLYKEAGITVHAVDGNHDQEDKEGQTHALQPLMAGGLLQGIGPKGYRIVKIDDVYVTMFAYCESRDVLAKRIESVKKRLKIGQATLRPNRHIALFHHGFKGARVGSSLEYEVKEPIDAKKLRLDKLFGLVFSGHYHTHQAIVGIRRGWYIGSPLEHTRSDRTVDAKGFLVVETKTLDFTREALNRPRFISIEVGDALSDVKGNFVDVVYAKADDTLDAYLAAVKQAGARGVNPIALPSAKVSKFAKRLNVSPTLAPSKVLKRYVKHRKRDIKRQKLDRSALMKLGLELVRAAES